MSTPFSQTTLCCFTFNCAPTVYSISTIGLHFELIATISLWRPFIFTITSVPTIASTLCDSSLSTPPTMSNIDAAHYEKVESASESIQPTGNDCLDVELDLARLAPHSKPRKFRKDDNLFETVPQCSPGFAPRTKSRNSVKDESPLLDALQWIFGHQIGILDCDTLSLLRCLIGLIAVSIILLMLLFWTHMCFPQTRTQTRKFFQLSYYNPDTGKYALGFNDASLVGYWVLVFTVLRAATMDYALMPLAKKAGVKTARDQVRFCEQAWLLVYYSFFWTLGMVGRSPCATMEIAPLTISVHHD